MTAVEYIEKGILARERHWHDQYQQGYQRALSDVMLLVDEAKQMEKEQIIKAVDSNFNYDSNNGYPTLGEQYYKETYRK